MAAADYRLCDRCGGKAFYDANLSYEHGPDGYGTPYLIEGEPQYPDGELANKYGMRLGYLGDWAVLCTNCTGKFKCVIVERSPQPQPGEQK